MICTDCFPIITVTLDFFSENPDAESRVVSRFKGSFGRDVQVFEPPRIDLQQAEDMGEATSAGLADDSQSAGAGAGAIILSGDVDDPRIEAGFRFGYGEDKPFGDAVA